MVRALEHDVFAIDVDYVRPGLASSHLIVADGRAAYVDTGTNHSVPALLDALANAGVDAAAVDYVFLTHIHLDHAGGAGALMQALPAARCVVHPRGARHLAEPGRLIAGSMAVYGETVFRELYGDIVPIPADRLISAEDGFRCTLGSRPFEFFHTEGHARHHHCIYDHAASGVFTGDSFGLSYREFDTAAGPFLFPTTTPVHFDPAAAHLSIDRIASYRPERLYLTHFSEIAFEERFVTELHADIDAFVDLVREHGSGSDAEVILAHALKVYLDRRLDAHGCKLDTAARHALLDLDCGLNAQGLLHWHALQTA